MIDFCGVGGKMRISPESVPLNASQGRGLAIEDKEERGKKTRRDAERAARELNGKRAAMLFQRKEDPNGSNNRQRGGSE